MKINLQGRLIVLMVVFSIFFVAIFTGIQVYNQLNRSSEFNYYKAKMGASLLQTNLHNAIKDIADGQTGAKEEKIKNIISVLYNTNIIGETSIITDNYEIIYSTYKFSRLDDEDRRIIKNNFIPPYSLDNIYSYVDKKSKLIKLFMPFSNTLLAKIEYDLGNIYKAMAEVYVPIVITIFAVIIANIFLATLLSRIIISPISLLNTVTSEVAAGNLDRKVDIKSGDELEELAGTFNYMTEELKRMKEIAENANPLTKLPGNIVIREEVEKRIKNNNKFLVIYCDLDNFKAFNDKYGIEAGDRAIKLTADVFKEAIAKQGVKEDFVGHEGGDDFILLTRPERAQKIADYIMSQFDARIKQLYNKEDLERGYIEAKSRQGELMKFPIMAISLAGVTNEIRPIVSYAEVTNIAAEVKKRAKATPGSCFFVDRRKLPWPPGVAMPT